MRVNAQSLAFGSDANLGREKGCIEGKRGEKRGQKGGLTDEILDRDGCLRRKVRGAGFFYSVANVRERDYIPPPASVEHFVRSTFTSGQVTCPFLLAVLRQRVAVAPCPTTIQEGGGGSRELESFSPLRDSGVPASKRFSREVQPPERSNKRSRTVPRVVHSVPPNVWCAHVPCSVAYPGAIREADWG